MSMGFLLPPDNEEANNAIVWRGPMLQKVIHQLLFEVNWRKTDVLVIDMPPGTGDVLMSVCQNTFVKGAIIVTTPQYDGTFTYHS